MVLTSLAAVELVTQGSHPQETPPLIALKDLTVYIKEDGVDFINLYPNVMSPHDFIRDCYSTGKSHSLCYMIV